jgi:hypothetical protein
MTAPDYVVGDAVHREPVSAFNREIYRDAAALDPKWNPMMAAAETLKRRLIVVATS